jgi:hypothetical protein
MQNLNKMELQSRYRQAKLRTQKLERFRTLARTGKLRFRICLAMILIFKPHLFWQDKILDKQKEA